MAAQCRHAWPDELHHRVVNTIKSLYLEQYAVTDAGVLRVSLSYADELRPIR